MGGLSHCTVNALVVSLLLVPIFPVSVLQAQSHDPIARRAAMIRKGNVRFTVLTPCVVRIEWTKDGQFEDRASLTIIRRNLPVPRFHLREINDTVRITTEALTMDFTGGADSLRIDETTGSKPSGMMRIIRATVSSGLHKQACE